MKKKLTILSAILSVSYLSLPSYAVDTSYRAELFAGYEEVSVDDDALDHTIYDLGGAYYFSSVNTANHPLAEAAFLEKSSRVYAGWTRSDYDDLNSTLDVSSVGVDFYVPDTILFLGAGLAQVNVSDESDDDSFWFAKLGVTPVDGLLLWAQIREEIDTTNYWDVNAKYVVPLSGENAINLEATYADLDDGDSRINIAADYYFTRNTSVGAGYSIEDIRGDDDSDDIYEIRVRHFFSDKFSLQAAYTTSEHEDGLSLGASLRF